MSRPTIARHVFPVAALALVFGIAIAGGAREAAAQSRPFTVAVNGEPDTLDMTITRESLANYVSLENVYEPLVSTDTDGKLIPGLATAWEFSPDGLKITFHLRQGVKFHSGDELVADDLAFTFARQKARTPYVRREIKQIEAVDKYTAVMELNYPSAGLLPSRSFNIVSKAYFDRVGEDEFVRKPSGTGPYRVTDYRQGQYLDLVRYDGYWGKKPALPQARYVFVKEDSTRVAMIRAKEADLVMNVPYSAVASLEQAGLKIAKLPSHPTITLQFNLANTGAPWGKRLVREAMARAIDRPAIVKGLLLGIPTSTWGLEPNELGYDPSLKAYDYDPALAKKLLAEAGYPNGFDFTLNYWAGNYFGLKETAETVGLYLRAVGIKANLQALDNANVMQTIRKSRGDANALFVGITAHPWANQSDPVEMFNIAFSSKSPFSLYNNPAFDEVSSKAFGSYNEADRPRYIREGVKILNEDVVIVPLWNYVVVYAMQPNVNFVPTRKHFPVVQLKDVTLAAP